MKINQLVEKISNKLNTDTTSVIVELCDLVVPDGKINVKVDGNKKDITIGLQSCVIKLMKNNPELKRVKAVAYLYDLVDRCNDYGKIIGQITIPTKTVYKQTINIEL